MLAGRVTGAETEEPTDQRVTGKEHLLWTTAEPMVSAARGMVAARAEVVVVARVRRVGSCILKIGWGGFVWLREVSLVMKMRSCLEVLR